MHRLIERERRGTGEWLFSGFVAAVLCLDVLVLVLAPPDGVAGALRLLLAVGASVTVPLGVVLGAAHGRPVDAVMSVLSAPVVVVYVVSGLLLPWNQLAFYTGQAVLDGLLAVPVLGDPLAAVFFGGATLTQRSLRLAFRYHYAAVAVGTVCLAAACGGVVYGRRVAGAPSDE